MDKNDDTALVPIRRHRAWNGEPTCCRLVEDKLGKRVPMIDYCRALWWGKGNSGEVRFICVYRCENLTDTIKVDGGKQWLPPLEGCPVWTDQKGQGK